MRLIDIDAIKLPEGFFEKVDNVPKFYDWLNSLPTIDIVRCKECKHRDPEDKKCDCGHDIIWQLPRNDNWFCADGERRDNER